jgi:hypothetical protein
MAKLPKSRQIAAFLCQSCGKYHPESETEVVVIKIIKGKNCPFDFDARSREKSIDGTSGIAIPTTTLNTPVPEIPIEILKKMRAKSAMTGDGQSINDMFKLPDL